MCDMLLFVAIASFHNTEVIYKEANKMMR